MKLYFPLIIIFLSQLSNAQTKFTIQAGAVSTNNYINNPFKAPPIYSPYFTNYLSFDIGVLMTHGLYKKINSETGLFYYQKGYKIYARPTPDYTSFEHDHLNYFTLNQNFSYSFLNFKKIILTTGIGAFLGKGVGGSFVKDTYNFGAYQHSEGKISFGNTTNDQFQSWDAGLNFLLRIGYKNFDITGMFSPSLTNHIPKASQQSVKEKLQSISVNLGYNF
jgi:hypothetical protein